MMQQRKGQTEMTRDEAFKIGEEIARGGKCFVCGAQWHEETEGELHHLPGCEYIVYLDSLPILDFTPIWGLTYPDDFNLEPQSMESGADLEPAVMIAELMKVDDENEAKGLLPPHTDLTHALMLFHKLADDRTFDGIDPAQLFAACCDTVLIWDRG
jgi:hypothetical protein